MDPAAIALAPGAVEEEITIADEEAFANIVGRCTMEAGYTQ